MFTIVGSGFGLYGYLPALVEGLGERVVLPLAYREKVEARAELQPCLGAIDWVADAAMALTAASAVAVAAPPRRQEEAVAKGLLHPRLDTFVLEKPLATTPDAAIALLEALERSRKRVRVGYTLLHTTWGSSLRLPRDADAQLAITWTFMAYHFAHALPGWKREHAQGGGVLRFFGVHLIALLAREGYREVRRSALAGEDAAQPERWEAVFAGPGRPDCRVSVDSRSREDRFAIRVLGGAQPRALVALAEPFEQEEALGAPGADRRVGVLARLLGTLRDVDEPYHGLYRETNLLWRKVEDATPPGPR
jgi:predicted dehydrogenase